MDCTAYYSEWKGHRVKYLESFHSHIRAERPSKPIVFLAGDSSLDNKYWISRSDLENTMIKDPAIYQQVFSGPSKIAPLPDIAYWINHMFGPEATALNCAIEESMLRERGHKLLPQDEFIRDHIQENDILVVSVGGNDIALKPNPSTIQHLIRLAYFTSRSSLGNGTAWAYPYFVKMFKDDVKRYIEQLIEKQNPRAVIVCMIYYPLEKSAGTSKSWADAPLAVLKYNSNPDILQMAIKKMFEMATCQIEIKGTKIIPCALFDILDSKNGKNYTARVEPSCEGGRKMAGKLKELIDNSN